MYCLIDYVLCFLSSCFEAPSQCIWKSPCRMQFSDEANPNEFSMVMKILLSEASFLRSIVFLCSASLAMWKLSSGFGNLSALTVLTANLIEIVPYIGLLKCIMAGDRHEVC